MKARIERTDQGWTLTRPGYGFNADAVTHHRTHKAALAALFGTQAGSASASLERLPRAEPRLTHLGRTGMRPWT